MALFFQYSTILPYVVLISNSFEKDSVTTDLDMINNNFAD